jgi:hypothetical protein
MAFLLPTLVASLAPALLQGMSAHPSVYSSGARRRTGRGLAVMGKWPLLSRPHRYRTGGASHRVAPHVRMTRNGPVHVRGHLAAGARRRTGRGLAVMGKWPLLSRPHRYRMGGASHRVAPHVRMTHRGPVHVRGHLAAGARRRTGRGGPAPALMSGMQGMRGTLVAAPGMLPLGMRALRSDTAKHVYLTRPVGHPLNWPKNAGFVDINAGPGYASMRAGEGRRRRMAGATHRVPAHVRMTRNGPVAAIAAGARRRGGMNPIRRLATHRELGYIGSGARRRGRGVGSKLLSMIPIIGPLTKSIMGMVDGNDDRFNGLGARRRRAPVRRGGFYAPAGGARRRRAPARKPAMGGFYAPAGGSRRRVAVAPHRGRGMFGNILGNLPLVGGLLGGLGSMIGLGARRRGGVRRARRAPAKVPAAAIAGALHRMMLRASPVHRRR